MTALFLVDRGGVNHHVSVTNVANMQPLDKVLVQRGKNISHAIYKKPGTTQPWASIRDTDLILAWDDNQSKHVTGAEFKSLFPNIPSGKVALDIRFVDRLDDTYRNLHALGVEAVYPFVTGANGVTKFLDDISPIPETDFQVPTVDMPSGYLYIGDPKTFAFGQYGRELGIGMEFGPFTDTSLWENSDKVFSNIQYCYGGLGYIDTSKFTSLDNMFDKSKMTYRVADDHYESDFPYEELRSWNTSNVTSFKYALKRPTARMPDLGWDFRSAVTAYYFMGSGYGIPSWVENIEWGPNLVDVSWFGGGFYADGPTSNPKDNYWYGQKTPLNFSKWDVRNIPSIPDGFMTSNPFNATGHIYNWVVEPTWGSDGGLISCNHNLLKLNTGPDSQKLAYDYFDIALPKGPDLNGNPIVYPPGVGTSYTTDVKGTITFATTDVNGNLVRTSHDVTYYTLNPSSGLRFYSYKTRPTPEEVALLQNGSDVYLFIDY